MIDEEANRLLDGLVPPEVIVRSAAIGAPTGALYPEEEATVARAVSARREGFRTGRVLAREALAALGVEPGPILVTASRAPHWPDGVIGSLSHTSALCAVAVAWVRQVRGLGVDLELCTRFDAAIEKDVASPAELALGAREGAAALFGGGGEAGGDAPWPLVLFSLKESLYKCLHPLVELFFSFRDVELAVGDGGRLEARLATSAAPELAPLSAWLPLVRFRGAVRAAHVVTTAVL